MANINLKTANKVEVIGTPGQADQFTSTLAEAITPGSAARIDTTTGGFTNANATTTTENRIFGIALNDTNPAARTVVRRGYLDGYDLSGLAFDAPVYLSDTDGRLSTTAGTTTVIVGRVVAGNSNLLGTTADKLLFVDL